MAESPPSLRIAFLDANIDAFYGGQRRMLVLMRGLLDHNEVLFVTTGNGELADRISADGVRVDILPASSHVNQFGGQLRNPRPVQLVVTGVEVARWSLRFAGWLRRNRIEVVVANDLRSSLLALAGSWLANVPLVWSVRDNVRQGRWHGVAARLASRIVPVSLGAAEVFTPAERERVADKLVVIHNGVPVAEPRPDARAALRAELGLEDDAQIVTHVGMLTPRKGHGDWFRAMAALVQAGGATARLAVVGHEPAGYDDYPGKLRALATKLGIADRVHWFGFREDAIDLIAGSDLLVLPSYNEGLPGVLIEALSVGVPVVAYDAAGAVEIIDPGLTGSIVPVGDIGALAAALSYWLLNETRRAEAGKVAKESMKGRFSVRAYIDSYENLLRATVQTRRQLSW